MPVMYGEVKEPNIPAENKNPEPVALIEVG